MKLVLDDRSIERVRQIGLDVKETQRRLESFIAAHLDAMPSGSQSLHEGDLTLFGLPVSGQTFHLVEIAFLDGRHLSFLIDRSGDDVKLHKPMYA